MVSRARIHDDDPVTWTQVLVTAVLGAIIGGLLAALCCVASETFRGWLPWSAIILVVGGAVVMLWLRYAPGWFWDIGDLFTL